MDSSLAGVLSVGIRYADELNLKRLIVVLSLKNLTKNFKISVFY